MQCHWPHIPIVFVCVCVCVCSIWNHFQCTLKTKKVHLFGTKKLSPPDMDQILWISLLVARIQLNAKYIFDGNYFIFYWLFILCRKWQCLWLSPQKKINRNCQSEPAFLSHSYAHFPQARSPIYADFALQRFSSCYSHNLQVAPKIYSLIYI